MPDNLNFPPDPTHWNVVQIYREATNKGEPCQVHLIVDYDNGVHIGLRKIIVNPGLLRDYGFADPEAKFLALWNLIPDVPQSVKDTIGEQIPVEMARDFWLGHKV